MYRAQVFMTMGFGLDKRIVVANNYADFKEKIAKVKAMQGTALKVLGFDTTLIIEKIVYSYPSGKTFLERF